MDKPPRSDLNGYPTFLACTYTRYLNMETYLEIVEEQKMKIEISSLIVAILSYLEILNFCCIKQPVEYRTNNSNHVSYISSSLIKLLHLLVKRFFQLSGNLFCPNWMNIRLQNEDLLVWNRLKPVNIFTLKYFEALSWCSGAILAYPSGFRRNPGKMPSHALVPLAFR